MTDERDYSGVSTQKLAELIRSRVPLGEYAAWAEGVGIPTRYVRRIFAGEYQFTGLGLADRICDSFDLRVDDEFEIIPADYKYAAAKMARDELEVAAMIWETPAPSEEEIEARALELKMLREKVLGTATTEQMNRLKRDSDRSNDRFARERAAVDSGKMIA